MDSEPNKEEMPPSENGQQSINSSSSVSTTTKETDGTQPSTPLDAAESALEQFEEFCGLHRNTSPITKSEALGFLDLSFEQRRKMTGEALFEAEYTLLRYSEYILRLKDQQLARASVAREEISRLIAKGLDKQSGYSYEERRIKAISCNVKATELDRMRVECEARAKRLESVGKCVADTARSFGQSAAAKSRQYNR